MSINISTKIIKENNDSEILIFNISGFIYEKNVKSF